MSKLLKHEAASVGLINDFGKSVLFLACENSQVEVAKLLVANDANINRFDETWGSIARAAAWGGNFEIFRHLCDKGVNLNDEPGYYSRVLDAGLRGGNEELVVLALDKGVHVWLSPEMKDSSWKVVDLRRRKVPGDSDALRSISSDDRTFDPHELRFDLLVQLREQPTGYFQPFYKYRHSAEQDTIILARKNLIERTQWTNLRRRELLRCTRLHTSKSRNIDLPQVEKISFDAISSEHHVPYDWGSSTESLSKVRDAQSLDFKIQPVSARFINPSL